MAEEILKKVNLFGQDYVLKGSGGAAGGSGGGGLALTGGAYVGAEGGITSTNRWLRFDFNDPNHRSLVILGGTSFTMGENIVTIDETTSYNLSDYLGEEGADYYVFINADGRVIASTLRTQPDGYMFIGQFHTLCDGVPANTIAIIPMQTGIIEGTSVTLCDYFKNQDLDFTNFYTKNIDAVNDAAPPYAVALVLHPLQGFNTGDILPESVWCLNFHPKCKNWDGMVYCNQIDKAVDIYCNNVNSEGSVSEYGTPLSRIYWINDVGRNCLHGKHLPSAQEFISYSLGSNQRSFINTPAINGGNSDTAGRRMISSIGCEDCCGYQWQIGNTNFNSAGEGTDVHAYDGRGIFGKQYENLMIPLFGGGTPHSAYPADIHGSYCFDSFTIGAGGCVRHVCNISIV